MVAKLEKILAVIITCQVRNRYSLLIYDFINKYIVLLLLRHILQFKLLQGVKFLLHFYHFLCELLKIISVSYDEELLKHPDNSFFVGSHQMEFLGLVNSLVRLVDEFLSAISPVLYIFYQIVV